MINYVEIFQVWPYLNLNLSIIIKLPFSEQEHVQIFPFPSPSKTCASLPFCARERPEKYLLLSEWCKRIIQTRSSIFCYLIDMNIYTQNLPVCNSGQHTYVTGLFNFFFVLQDSNKMNSTFTLLSWLYNPFKSSCNEICEASNT